MNDDPVNLGAEDSTTITLDLDHEVQYWTAKWDVTHYAPREAIAEVRPYAKDVAALQARARLRRRAQLHRDQGRALDQLSAQSRSR